MSDLTANCEFPMLDKNVIVVYNMESNFEESRAYYYADLRCTWLNE